MLRGVMVPMVTPMSSPGRPSAGHAELLIDRLAESGIHGLLLFGSNGEGPALTIDAMGEFAQEVTRGWRARRPDGRVVINVSAVATEEALRRAGVVLGAEPDAVALTPPMYFRYRPDEVSAHYQAFADLGVPVVAYNIPRYTGNPITVDVFRELVAMPHIIGVKDSSADAETFAQLLEVAAGRDDFGVSQGDEGRLVEALRDGAHGIVPGFANLAPSLAVDLVRSVEAGEESRAEQRQAVVAKLAELYRIRAGVPAMKAALDLLGVCPPHAAMPFAPCTQSERERIRAHLEGFTQHLST